MKRLQEKKLKYINEGCFGEYYRINKRTGIKVMREDYLYLRDLRESYQWKECKAELEVLKKAYRLAPRSFPKPMTMAIVQRSDRSYNCGYIMSHVEGKPVDDCSLRGKDWDRLEKAELRICKLGIEMHDSHHNNVIKSKNRFVFVDAGRLVIKKKKRR